MATEVFERQVLQTLSHLEESITHVKEELDVIKERIVDDAELDREDKDAIEVALQEERNGPLLSKERVFRQ